MALQTGYFTDLVITLTSLNNALDPIVFAELCGVTQSSLLRSLLIFQII